MHFNTRFLLAITAWAAMSYAMAFSIPPNLLAFIVGQWLMFLVVSVGIMLPLFVDMKHRNFWFAFSISAVGLLAFSMSGKSHNPIAAWSADMVVEQFVVTDNGWSTVGLYDYARGFIGQWHALYFVFEIHLILAFAAVAGVIWQKLGSQSPFWLVGIWFFLWAVSISKEVAGIGSDWSQVTGFLLMVIGICVLPVIAVSGEKLRPLLLSFSIAAFLGCLHLPNSGLHPPVFSNPTIAAYFPNLPASVGEHLLQAFVVVMAILVGVIVQVVVSRISTPDDSEVVVAQED